MKVSIIGGGPAGLYLASSIKTLNPDYAVTVFEAKNESVHALGLGYTLQTLGTELLRRQDPHFPAKLFADTPTMRISQALYKTHCSSRHFDFTEGVSVTRIQLRQYLLKRCEELGIIIKEKKISPARLKRLQQSSDLVVGADGVNSIVRERYAHAFKAQSFTADLRYSWFINESPQLRTEACFYAFQAKEGVVMLTSYPLTPNKQVVIIEMTKACLDKGNFRGKCPEQAVPYLNEVLGQNGDMMNLKSAGLPWYAFKMNCAEKVTHQNVALVGDSAYSFHFSAGQGVTTAFTMAYSLAQCLQKNNDLNQALQHYSKTVKMSLEQPEKASMSVMRWLEGVDQHFSQSPDEDLIELFRLKEQFTSDDLSRRSA